MIAMIRNRGGKAGKIDFGIVEFSGLTLCS